MVALLEQLELEVPKHTAETLLDLLVMIRIAESTEREVDGSIETAQRLSIDSAVPERTQDRANAGRTLGHPGRRIA